MEMDWMHAILVIITGFIAGFINTIAGGGSLLTVPALIFLGLPSAVANATNRVAIFLQNTSGVAGYQSKGVNAFPYSIWLGVSALAGSVAGAKMAVDIEDALFNKALAVVMIVVIAFTIFNPIRKVEAHEEKMSFRRQAVGVVVFFFVGIYGGFIQAGVGFLILGALTAINRFNLVKANSAKVFVIGAYTAAALTVFIIEDQINWWYGLTLAAGNMSGAWIASRMSVTRGDKWVKRFLVVAVAGLAIRLWFF